MAYGPEYPCPAVQVLCVVVMDLQGEYYEEDYGEADGWGFASCTLAVLIMMFLFFSMPGSMCGSVLLTGGP